MTLLLYLESTKYLGISKVFSHSFTGASQRIPFIPEWINHSRLMIEEKRKRTTSNDVRAHTNCGLKISVTNGSVHWPVGSGQWQTTDKQSIQRIARSFTRHYLDCYVRARSTRARNISSPSWTLFERATKKIYLVCERKMVSAMHMYSHGSVPLDHMRLATTIHSDQKKEMKGSFIHTYELRPYFAVRKTRFIQRNYILPRATLYYLLSLIFNACPFHPNFLVSFF